MPPQAPTSFIPKKPLDTGRPVHEPGSLGFLFFISLFVFIASIVAAGAIFAGKAYFTNAIAQKSSDLAKAEGAFDPATIQELIRLDSRINNGQVLLQKHISASSFLAFLGQQTLVNVQFTNMALSMGAGGTASVVLQGTAKSFADVALQSDQFGASKILKDVVFSGVRAGAGASGITFSVNANVDPSILNYAKNLGTISATPVAPPQAQMQTQGASTTPPTQP